MKPDIPKGDVKLHLIGKRSFKYSGKGHTGFVVEYNYDESEKKITTVEANTNQAGSSNGDGVYKKFRNKKSEVGSSDLEVVVFLVPFKKA